MIETLNRLIERIQTAVLAMPSIRPMDIGNRAEINRRLRIIQGTERGRCTALVLVPKGSSAERRR